MTSTGAGLRVKIRSLFCSTLAMVLVGLCLRLVVMGFVYKAQLEPSRDHWAFGVETGRVARSIATGKGFSSPFPDSEPTGPTAFIPPAYAYLLAGVFKLFGVYTAPAALAILTLNNIFSALTCLPVFFIARRVFGLRVATWAGWTWAMFPYSIALSNNLIWETCLTTLLLTLSVLATLHMERSQSLVAWMGYGLLWGITALTGPASLSLLPFLGAWIWFRHWRRGSHCSGLAVAASLVFLATVAPWMWRCSRAYGHFVSSRTKFGLEVIVGNSDDTSTPVNLYMLPSENRAEMDELRRVGEPAYLAEKQQQARELVARDPLRYAGLILRRILYTWTALWNFPPRWKMDESYPPNILVYSLISLLAFTGLVRATHNGRDGVVPLMILPVVFPLVYYLTHPAIQYRHPIDPVIVIFLVYGAMSFRGRDRKSPVEESPPGALEGPCTG